MQQIFAIIVFSFLIISLLITFIYAVINRRRVLANQIKKTKTPAILT